MGFIRRLTRPLRRVKYVYRNFYLDFKDYMKYSSVKENYNDQYKLRANIIFDYHKIEKGLSFQEPKLFFGKSVIENLLLHLNSYKEKYGFDEIIYAAIESLIRYIKFHNNKGVNLPELEEKVNSIIYKEDFNLNHIGGIKEVTKKEILNASKLDFENFTNNRYSIRNFSDDDIPIDELLKAIKIAQKTPSVCNRQTSKVYILKDKEKKMLGLSFQNGNIGFGEQASAVLLVTANYKDFRSSIERNQPFIDGGMFSMSLIYAFHSLGIGSCALNLALDNLKLKDLKSALDIDKSEVPIMMIAVGYLPEKFNVAISHRKKLDEIVSIL